MNLITEGYRERIKFLHERTEPTPDGIHIRPYGSVGHWWAAYTEELADATKAETILDYGCGKGGLKEALKDRDITNYDPATFPTLPEPADLVVCADVLPFVEEECLEDVLQHIQQLAKKALLLIVPQHPYEKHQGKGLQAKDLDWWQETLAKYWPSHRVEFINRHGRTPRLKFVWRHL